MNGTKKQVSTGIFVGFPEKVSVAISLGSWHTVCYQEKVVTLPWKTEHITMPESQRKNRTWTVRSQRLLRLVLKSEKSLRTRKAAKA